MVNHCKEIASGLEGRVAHIAPLLQSRWYFINASDSIQCSTRGLGEVPKPPFKARHRMLKFNVGGRAISPDSVDLGGCHRTVVI